MGEGSQICDPRSWPGLDGLLFPHGLATQCDAIGVMDDAIQDRVGKSGVTQISVPLLDRKLAGDDGAAALEAVVDDLQQIALTGVGERDEPEVIEDEQLEFGQVFEPY